MKKVHKPLFILITLFSIVMGFAGIGAAADFLLEVPERIQGHSQWCWVGSSKAVLDYYGTDTGVSQCSIANWAWGRTDCCASEPFDVYSVCNQPNYMYGATGSLQDILSHWGVASNSMQTHLSQSGFVSQIASGKPFVMRFGWTGGGGHFLDGYGYHQDGNYMDYMDPWPGNGYTRSAYGWVVSSSNHSWTHTLQITSKVTALHSLSLALQGNGGGSITGTGVNCTSGTCVYTYHSGTSVTLKANAASGSVLTGWTGCDSSTTNTCHVAVNADKTVTATFIVPPRITVSPASVNFGAVKEGKTYSTPVTVNNTGLTDLIVSVDITPASAAEFSASDCGSHITKGSPCTINVGLSPTSYGAKAAKLLISSNDPAKPSVSVNLKANAMPPKISVSPVSVNFGTVKIGTPLVPSRTVTVKNTGVTDLTVTVSDPTDHSFAATPHNCSAPILNGGTPCTITVTFDPTDTVQKNAEIDITSNAAASLVKVRLLGKGH